MPKSLPPNGKVSKHFLNNTHHRSEIMLIETPFRMIPFGRLFGGLFVRSYRRKQGLMLSIFSKNFWDDSVIIHFGLWRVWSSKIWGGQLLGMTYFLIFIASRGKCCPFFSENVFFVGRGGWGTWFLIYKKCCSASAWCQKSPTIFDANLP